jgi:hypothetical protein
MKYGTELKAHRLLNHVVETGAHGFLKHLVSIRARHNSLKMLIKGSPSPETCYWNRSSWAPETLGQNKGSPQCMKNVLGINWNKG